MFNANSHLLARLLAMHLPEEHYLFLRLILKSEFRAKVATWKTENLYLYNKYSVSSGSAILHLERELKNKLPPWPHLSGNKKAICALPHGCSSYIALCIFPTRAISVMKTRMG